MGYKILQIQKKGDGSTIDVLVDFGNGQIGSVSCASALDANGVKSQIDSLESSYSAIDPTLPQEIKDLVGYEKP